MLRLRRPWRDGTRAIRFEPGDLLEQLAALVPRPRANRLLYHAFAARGGWRVARTTAAPAPIASSYGLPAPPAHTGYPQLIRATRPGRSRWGKKRAIGALKHSMLTDLYFMVRDQVAYHDPGADHFTRLNPEQQTRYHVRKLKALGHRVALSPIVQAA